MEHTATRPERDSFGVIDVPSDRLWGAQTQRSLRHFAISTERMPREFVRALGLVKQVAAQVNLELGLLPRAEGLAVARAAGEVAAGAHDAEFPLSIWQTGSGTQAHMNANEVIANRASELLGGVRGEQRIVHPNDDVNRGQSSNDVVPTALHVAAATELSDRLLPEVRALAAAFRAQAARYADLVKLGRTHLMDAVPLTLGQELGGYAAQLEHAAAHLAGAQPHLHELAIGGTAVGTGLNTAPDFGERVAAGLAARTGLPFVRARNGFEALAAGDALVQLHGALKGLAVALYKVANDLRWLASGPRGGIGELRLPENEPGSSLMPGKVNPTQCEALVMLCAQVMGNDVAVGLAGAGGWLELNVSRPLFVHAVLQSLRLLTDGCRSFRVYAVEGLEADERTIRAHVERSLMLATALVPRLGYDTVAQLAQKAHAEGLTLRQAAVALGLSDGPSLEAALDPAALVGHRNRAG
jgi:fumarate hydratase class II